MMLRSSALSLVTAAAALLGNSLHAQQRPCYTDEMRQRMVAENPGLLHQEQQYEHGLQEYLQARAGMRDGDTTTYVLPVVFHILYDPTLGNDVHNISDAQIYDAVNIMNRDYAKLNADLSDVCCGFDAIAADIHVKFQLATKDPLGNCTNGIDRITSQRSTNGSNFSKLKPWFRDHYINIWVVSTLASDDDFSPAGFSQLPPDVADASGALRDGVILLHDYTGSIGTSSVFTSRTLTHEVGHYLNLKHTWGGTNAPEVACGDDNVDDTPVTKGHLSCNLYDSYCSLQPTDTSYTFNDVTLTSGTTDPSPAPTVLWNDTGATTLTFSPFHAVGVSANSSEAGNFSFSQWDGGAHQSDSLYTLLTGSQNMNRYYEFTVTPEVGKSMSPTAVTFRVNRSATGPRTFAIRSSVGNSPFQSNLTGSVIPSSPYLGMAASNTVFFFKRDTTVMVTNGKVALSGAGYVNVPGPITFRIYAWNAEDSNGYFTVDSVGVKGNAGIIENVQNYMEYSYCSRMFTDGQRDRMRATLNSDVSGRNSLWTGANHQLTGTDGYETTCGPQAGFYSLTSFACPGVGIQFKDNSTRATPTSWAWSFEGGNPSTSTDPNPVVSFDQPGPHNVTLTVGNDYGSNTFSKDAAVMIGANYSEVGSLLNEPFDTEQAFSKWPVVNYENNESRWLYSNNVGHNAVGCTKLNASDTYTLIQDMFNSPDAYFADKDELVTPSLDLQHMSNITLNFWFAYAARTTVMTDITESLKVYSSTNCGESWLLRKTITGGDMVTAGIQTPGYLPGPSDWREVNVSLPPILSSGHVRFKFVYTSGLNSNDIYIDDINMDGTIVGIDELAQSGSLSLMPNPATNRLTVDLDLAGASNGTLSFLDMTGRTVYAQAVNAGEKTLNFDLGRMGITSGVYLVQLKHEKGQRVERLVVQ
ncbi:MAG: T9SS type A sorting domain-containing protein [Bacteroidetes bacterium]|nr:T9SS type A sorting domain-containing protein [Bacteroidota bacterium]